jgi:hypothetical protein
MRRPIVTLLVAGTVALGAALVAPAATAQSGPGAAGTRAKRAASNAAAKTDAHTRAVQEPTATPERAKTTGVASRGQMTQTSQTSHASPAQEAKQAGAPGAGRDDASVAVRGGKDEVGFRREAFKYERSGRRDPFLSLLHSHDLRPMINDLKLVAVLYDPVGRSWAVMRDMTTNEQYRVKVGQQLGRMRVIQIHPKSVTFTIEEIGFSRQQTLALNDSKEREP